MAIPFRDSLEPRRFPWVTFGLIVVNCFIFLFIQPSAFQTAPDRFDPAEYERIVEGERFVMTYGMVPCEVRTGTPVIEAPDDCESPETRHLPEEKSIVFSLFSSMFLHGNIEHLLGNMLFLWVFGKNVEDRLGRLPFFALYILGGLAADLTSILVRLESAIPHLGASGAIAAAMGAYLVCYPRARILTQMVLPLQIVYIPAWVVLVAFFVTQFFIGSDSGVAWEAHAGGMAAGVLLGLLALQLPSVKALARPPSDQEAAATRSF